MTDLSATDVSAATPDAQFLNADPHQWRCKCGSPVMLADTEDWPEPCCYNCAPPEVQ